MTDERISASDLRDFQEGRDGPAMELYRHCLKKMIELVDGDLRQIFITDLIRHAKGTSDVSMELTFRTFARVQRAVKEESAGLDPDPSYVESV